MENGYILDLIQINIKKNNKNVNPTIANRLPILKKEIEKQFRRIENNENREFVERIYLYFDE